jgi:thiamine pyrophosphate-dependent acetolactate synthase large subunit-like protein
MAFGSDVVAEVLRRLDIEFVCINPGSSFRGLHDSLVNYLGNDRPKLVLALHEETAVAIAHGFAKASGRPMGVVVHSNVGLMHAMMAIYNAWCDRVPMLIVGATGAVDAAVRRNWIDWAHTFRDQAGLVRQFVKWDDQPASPEAAVEALLRAYRMACTPPCAPAYVILDRRLQEDALTREVAIPDVRRFAPPTPGLPGGERLEAAARLLAAARRPVLLMGRVSQTQPDWDARVHLAEILNARVVTDLRTGATFPTDHPLHAGPADLFLSPRGREVLAEADVVLSLDWIDLADVIAQAQTVTGGPAAQTIIQASVDATVHNGWSGDHQRLAAIDINLAVHPDAVVEPVTKLLEEVHGRRRERRFAPAAPPRTAEPGEAIPTLADIGTALASLRQGRQICLARIPLNWPAGSYHFHEPLDYLGYDGAGGVGSGPGMTVGAAMALHASGRIVIGIIGDGEFLAAPTALWTAAHYAIPFLMIVANNRSYFTDEIQQETVARERNRLVENRWIGQRLDDPAVNIAGLARDLGVGAEGPVGRACDLAAAFARGLAIVETGKPYLIDVLIDPSRGSSMDWLADA